MKNIFNITLIFITAFLLVSCRNGDHGIPEDVHEHDEIGKVVLKLTNKNNSADVHIVNIISGVADGDLDLNPGDSYFAELDFQIKHEDHYHSSEEIEEEKDHHFITFSPANTDIAVLRSAEDIIRTDGQKLGLKTEWTVNSTQPTGKMNIKLVHGAVTVNQNYPSLTNQLGQTTGGEADVDIIINVH